jgi:calcineurin-like phosphoesterase family protein
MDYFVSDLHFGHKNILAMERVQFTSIQEHDEFLFSVLNKTLHKDDVLYNLGDFAVCSKERTLYYLERYAKLPCRKIIILGNHDPYSSLYDKYFDTVSSVPIWYSKRILLSHEPMPVTDGCLNLHGHLHSAYIGRPNYINCNIHELCYQLLKEDDVQKRLQMLPKDSAKFLHEWYAPLYIIEPIPLHEDLVLTGDRHIDIEATLAKH